MQIKVKLFGVAAELVGQRELMVDLAERADVGALLDALCERFPALDERRAILKVAVNLDYARDSTMLEANDEVAIIPPVSGGQA